MPDVVMNRREALRHGAVVGGALLVAAPALLASCARSDRRAEGGGDSGTVARGVLSADDMALMAAIADTLLPDTAASPGAAAAGAGPAIQLLVTDCYEPAAQQRLIRGLADMRAAVESHHRAAFTSRSRSDREGILRELDAAARARRTPPTPGAAPEPHWFSLAREVAERAYFSSEIGMTRALRYVRVPGHFTGCMPLAPGQPAWG